MRRLVQGLVASAALALVLCDGLRLAAQEDDFVEPQLSVRVYRVSDLVMSAPAHAYRGIHLPGGSLNDLRGLQGGMGGGGFGGSGGGFGGGGSGGGAAGGAGFFQVDDEAILPQFAGAGGAGGGMAGGGDLSGAMGPASGPHSARFGMDDLVMAITRSIEPSSWDSVGGSGTIVTLGGMLIVNQTEPVHIQIEALLDALRAEGGALRTVTIEAQWLLLAESELSGLLVPQGGSWREVDPTVLATLSDAQRPYRGEVTCFDGQTVHIVSGRTRSVVQGAVPVVGGQEVGYQPIVNFFNAGALLEVTPSLVPGDEVAVLDLQSYVTRWDEPGPPIEFPQAFAIERTNVVVHQFGSTVQAPLGKPIVAGGLTLDTSEGAAAGDGGQLYLIVTVTSSAQPTAGAMGGGFGSGARGVGAAAQGIGAGGRGLESGTQGGGLGGGRQE